MAHLFKLDAAQQQVNRRGAPHIRFVQGLVANHRHTDRVRLGRGVTLALDIPGRHRTLFHLRDRLAGFAVEHKDHALLAGLYQHRGCTAFIIRQIVEQRLGRQVKVPQIVVGGLEMPANLTGRSIYRDNRGAVFIVQLGTLARVEVWRGVTGREVDQVQLCVVRHG